MRSRYFSETIIIVSSLLFWSTALYSNPRWPDAWNRRGIQLGTPLAEFKTLPHPDTATNPSLSKLKIICSNGIPADDSVAFADFRYLTMYEPLGTKCSWFDSYGDGGWLQYDISLSDGFEGVTTFIFAPSEIDPQQPLYIIYTEIISEACDKAFGNLLIAYGPAIKDGEGELRLAGGGLVNARQVTFANKTSAAKYSSISPTKGQDYCRIEQQLLPIKEVVDSAGQSKARSAF